MQSLREERAWWHEGKVYFLEIEKVEKFSKAAMALDEATILKDPPASLVVVG